MSLDVLYVTWNRLGYTRFSFRTLVENTNWAPVSKLVIHDDGSWDGTREFLDQARRQVPVPVEFRHGEHLGSAPAVMDSYVATSDADWFAKIDNDIIVPSGWLDAMLSVVEANPEIDCLGMEAGRGFPVTPEWDGTYGWHDGTHMGGVGLIRVTALAGKPCLVRPGVDGQSGWSLFQHEYGKVKGNGQLTIGWISPDLAVVQLDRVPFDPWASLSEQYAEEAWSRPWGKYHKRADYWDSWPAEARGV